MSSAYQQLLIGLAFSIVLIYLLIVVNFQSWLDPFVIITALPAALAGIVWMLFLTHTNLSVPALTGAIMCMGVATANSILVVSFAREQLAGGEGRGGGRARGRRHALQAGADDGARHDHRHGCRWRSSLGRTRRSDAPLSAASCLRLRDAVVRADRVLDRAPAPAKQRQGRAAEPLAGLPSPRLIRSAFHVL